VADIMGAASMVEVAVVLVVAVSPVAVAALVVAVPQVAGKKTYYEKIHI
jgi:hypothetical protein